MVRSVDLDSQRMLRFGIICSGTSLPSWQEQCIESLLKGGEATAVLLIIADPHAPNRYNTQKGSGRGEAAILWKLYDRMLLSQASRSTTPKDASGLIQNLPAINWRVETSGEGLQSLTEDVLEEIRRYDLDFVLQFTPQRLQGEILRIPRYGVWSFQHGDPDKYRGAPPCFWEIFNGDPVTGATLQRCVDGAETGIILRRGYFKTFARSYARNRDSVLFGSSDWPQQVCRDIQRGGAAYIDHAPSSAKAPTYHLPSNLEMLRFAWISAKAWMKNTVDWLFHQQQWNVGIIDAPIHEVLKLTRGSGSGDITSVVPRAVRWLPETKGVFLADPFGIADPSGSKSRVTILAEEYPWKKERGRISILESADGQTFGGSQPVIELPCHMSYPFLFEHDGHIYCIPETFEAREVSLFRASATLKAWTKVATLLKDFPAVDSTVFRHDGRWWLLCTSQEAGPNSTLFAWYADELTGPWEPHRANPLKVDIRSGRPAGTPFVHDGELYRPAQDCSTGYGAAVVINRILALTPSEFSEEVVAVLKPDPHGPYPNGLHTICVLPGCTIIDGARRTFIPQVFVGLMGRKMKRLMQKLRARLRPPKILSQHAPGSSR
ncbi:glucosamine inositolphosphorylceramide transferase family protein [Microvirga guangxiensis]|uniref:Glucosamine inositolphosphorylceramide transferase 1 N-terminal domain-containing protein n=1 Tax=Microvirga guangxiensis TaxID=549386 RepID=A0A1G5I6U3_9HYPH|nr:hypothetical protein [Microvirga guangxiensis]SCY71733.1 hypothetical protein SAMN02927923_02114 [Microvirga guangxiensis]